MTLRDPITHTEGRDFKKNAQLNWLRAAVLGANDGIVSVSSVMLGVAAATPEKSFVVTAGIAATVAGALSMAVGEYVSVSSQRDTEKALLQKERFELETLPEEELEELTQIYEKKGLSRETAERVAAELTAHDAFRAHVEAELGIDMEDLSNPAHAAYASGAAFLAGSLIPILAIILTRESLYLTSTIISVLIALIITGGLSAYVSGARKGRAVLRVVLGGIIAMVITYGVGKIFGIAGL